MNEVIKSENIVELSAALSKAQAFIQKAGKDAYNPFFKSKYADLGSVLDAIKPALTQTGLSFVQMCNDHEDHASISTIILHSSGQWIHCGTVAVPVSKKDAQGYGSALTYARRYSLAAAFGVAADDDDDGNAAANKKGDKPMANAQPSKPSPLPLRPLVSPILASEDQIIVFNDLCKELKIGGEAIKKRCATVKASRLEDIPAEIISKWTAELQTKQERLQR